MEVLVTGGTGYIGSHVAVELMSAGHDVVIADNLSNSHIDVLDRIEKITGKRPVFVCMDVCNRASMNNLFSNHDFQAVVHLAGMKAVGDSVKDPLKYYRTNVDATLSVCETMNRYGVRNIVFSSSATVYGSPERVPVSEDAPVNHAENPYGETKIISENILKNAVAAGQLKRAVCLRYFNPIGAHESGLLGEDPVGKPNNLMPILMKAEKENSVLGVFGNDYDTKDGTCIRDYIHICDLARAHLLAVEKLRDAEGSFWKAYNIGTGKGYSVLDIIDAYGKACGKKIRYDVQPRRPGDVPVLFADPSLAKQELGWKAERDLQTMCRDAVLWAKNN